ncbi:unnamed protein product [Linum tenue]|uniref:Secreted protein n=1 Tax=Linum tenue TaxID=586396 RepID=A0AAV0MI04_9ROSI|nr:unnamed protein product [Linum tenue]
MSNFEGLILVFVFDLCYSFGFCSRVRGEEEVTAGEGIRWSCEGQKRFPSAFPGCRRRRRGCLADEGGAAAACWWVEAAREGRRGLERRGWYLDLGGGQRESTVDI